MLSLPERSALARHVWSRTRLCSRLCDASRNGSACVAHNPCTSASVKSLVKNPVTGCPFGSTCASGEVRVNGGSWEGARHGQEAGCASVPALTACGPHYGR